MSNDCPIVFEDVRRHFGERAVLRGLTMQVRAGEIHAFLGRNGSGKTTALRILLGLLAPHGGRSTLLGMDSRLLGPRERGRVGYISEDHRLYRFMRVADVLSFEAGTRAVFDAPLAAEATRRCGLPGRVPVGKLSRGQRAQLALVVALSSRPDVLVCDDPALGLDVVMRREFLDVLIDLLSGRGVSVLLSTHVLSDVERVADRVSILDGGRLIVDATLDDLKRRVQRRPWQGQGDLPVVPGLLCSTRRWDGHDLLLLDATPTTLAALVAGGARLGDPTTTGLDDLFMDLTRGQTQRIVPYQGEESSQESAL